MPDRSDWPGWDDDAAGAKGGTAVVDLKALGDLEGDPPKPGARRRAGGTAAVPAMDLAEDGTVRQAKSPDGALPLGDEDDAPSPRRRSKKGEMPADWAKKPAAAATDDDDDDDGVLTEEELRAIEERNRLMAEETLAQLEPAFRPVDVAAILAAVSAEAISPTRILLRLPEDQRQPISEETQKLVQCRRREDQLVAAGKDPEEAASEARRLLDAPWVRIQLSPAQQKEAEAACGHPMETLCFQDPQRDIDRSMHRYSPKETSEMLAEVGKCIAYYEALCELEKGQLVQAEVEGRVSRELAKKKKQQDAALVDSLPKVVIDPKTAKKNAKLWKKATTPSED